MQSAAEEERRNGVERPKDASCDVVMLPGHVARLRRGASERL